MIVIQKMGDHSMVVGEVKSAMFDDKKFPLIQTRRITERYQGKNYQLGKNHVNDS